MEDLDFDEMLTSTEIKEEAKKEERTSNSNNKDKEVRLYNLNTKENYYDNYRFTRD